MRLAEEKLKLEAKLANTDYEVVQRNKRKLNQEILEARAHINSKEMPRLVFEMNYSLHLHCTVVRVCKGG